MRLVREEGKSLPGLSLGGLLFDPCHGAFRVEKCPAEIGKSNPKRRCSDAHFRRIRSPSTMCGGMGSTAVNEWLWVSRLLVRVLQATITTFVCKSRASGAANSPSNCCRPRLAWRM